MYKARTILFDIYVLIAIVYNVGERRPPVVSEVVAKE
jgi:hypothetical protein